MTQNPKQVTEMGVQHSFLMDFSNEDRQDPQKTDGEQKRQDQERESSVPILFPQHGRVSSLYPVSIYYCALHL